MNRREIWEYLVHQHKQREYLVKCYQIKCCWSTKSLSWRLRERDMYESIWCTSNEEAFTPHADPGVGANPIISQRNNKRISSKFNELNKKGAPQIVGIIFSTAKWSIPSPTRRYLSTYYYYEIWRWYIHLKIAFLSNLIWKSKALPQISVSLSWCHLFVNFFFNQKGCILSPISFYQNVKEEKRHIQWYCFR